MRASTPTARGASLTTPASRYRFAPPPAPAPTCGRNGTRSAVRRSCCAASIPICCPAPPRARWRRAVRAHASSRYPAWDMRRCCSPTTRSRQSSSSCVRPYNPRARFGSFQSHPALRRSMSLALRLPPFADRPREAPEIRPARVASWLIEASTREPGFAARIMGDALAATNRVSMSHARRLDLTEQYWRTAALLWPRLEHRFIRASHPLQGDDLDAAKGALNLANELSTSYKRLLASEAARKFRFGGPRRIVALVRRTFQATARVLTNSYLTYSPVPAHPWYDAPEIYLFTRQRKIHRHPVTLDQPDITLERLYTQSLLLALANPYGFLPSQLAMVLHYLQDNAQLAKLTPVPPVHRLAKAVAIVPVGHDFPPFYANKGGNAEGTRLFLLTFDLAFELQEQIRAIEAGAALPREAGSDPDARGRHIALLKRLLRQWAIPPARQFNRLPSRAQVAICAGLSGVWHYSRGTPAPNGASSPPPMTQCQVVNHTTGGYALRQ